MEWSDEEKSAVQGRISDFLSKSTPAVYVDSISSSIATQKPFAANNPISKLVQNTFNKIVNPIPAIPSTNESSGPQSLSTPFHCI